MLGIEKNVTNDDLQSVGLSSKSIKHSSKKLDPIDRTSATGHTLNQTNSSFSSL